MSQEEPTYSKVLSKQVVEDPTPPEEPPKPKKKSSTAGTKKKTSAPKKKNERVPVMSSSGNFVLYYKDSNPSAKRERDSSGKFVSSSAKTKTTTTTTTKSTTSTVHSTATATKKRAVDSLVSYPPCEPDSTLKPRVKAVKKRAWQEVRSQLLFLPVIALGFLIYYFGAYLLLSFDFANPEVAKFLSDKNLFALNFEQYGYNEMFAFISPLLFVGAVNFSIGYLAFYGRKLVPHKVTVSNPWASNRTSMPKATISKTPRAFGTVVTVIASVLYAVALFLVLYISYVDYFAPNFTESDTWIPFTQKNFITQKEPLTFVVNAIIAGLLCAGVNIFIAVKDAPVWVFALCNFLIPLLTYFIVALVAIGLFILVVLGIIEFLRENF